MKKNTQYLLLLCLFCLSNLLYAQERKYPVQLPTLNFLSYQYTIGAEITAYEQYKITLKDSEGNSKEISLSPFRIDKFREAIKAEFKQLTKKDSDIYEKYFTTDNDATMTELNQIFFAFKAADIAIEDLENAPEALKCYFNEEVIVWKNVKIPNKKIRQMISDIKSSNHHNFSAQIDALKLKLKEINQKTNDIKNEKDNLEQYLTDILKAINELVLNKSNLPKKEKYDEKFLRIKSTINSLINQPPDSLTKQPTLHNLKVVVSDIERILYEAIANDPIKDWYYYKKNRKEGRYIYQGNGYKKRKAKKLLKKQWIDREYVKKVTEYNEEKINNDTLSIIYENSESHLKAKQNEVKSMESEVHTTKDSLGKNNENIEKLSLKRKDKVDVINKYVKDVNNLLTTAKDDVDKLSYPESNYIGELKNYIKTAQLGQIKISNEKLDPAKLKDYQKSVTNLNEAIKIDEIDALKNNEIKKFKESEPESDSDPTDLSAIDNPELNSLKILKNELISITEYSKNINQMIGTLNSIDENINELTETNDKLKIKYKIDTSNFKALQESLKKIQLFHNTNTTTLISSNNKLLSIKKQFPKINLEINEIEMEINDGFIENISVIGDITIIKADNEINDKPSTKNPLMDKSSYNSRKIKFENYAPIGFSRKHDFRNFNRQYLIGELPINNEIVKYKLNLSELFPLINEKLAVDRRDYSPKNQYVSIDPKNRNDKFISLKKETTARLFEAKVYSDFVGFDEANPNGIIQTEIHKYISIDTRRLTFKKEGWKWFNVGFFGYLEPFIVISKIENTSKNLKISNIDRFIDGKYSPIKYASTLEIKRHESFSTGFTFNAITLDFPWIKSTLLFNLAFSYGITPAEDSIKRFENNELVASDALDEFKINTYGFTAPEIKWEIRSDERYGFNIVARMDWYWARTNKLIQVSNEEVFLETRDTGANANWLNSVELNGFLKTSDTSSGRLFFRYRYNWQKNYWKTGFNQLQVGYSFYILKRSES